MIAFFATLLRLFFQAFRSKRNVLSENALLKQENEILLRKVGNKRDRFSFYDKLFFVVLNKAADIKYRLTLVKPESGLQSRIRQNRSGSAQYEQYHGTILQIREKRGAGQFSADWQKSDREDS